MAETIAEKIFSRAAGSRVRPGEYIEIEPDWAFTIDDSIGLILSHLASEGIHRVAAPERIALFFDHFAPADNRSNATDHARAREFAHAAGVKHFFDVGAGISHQVAIDKGIVRPGEVALNSDSHTTTLGAIGCLGTGISTTEMAYVWAVGRLWFRVPSTIRVDLVGSLPERVGAKDVMLTLLSKLGARGATYKVLEYAGSGVTDFSISERMTLCNMAVELGAKAGIVAADDVTSAHYRRLGIEIDPAAGRPDQDATYDAVHHLSLAEIEPMVACPHRVDNVKPARKVAAARIHQAFLGSCTNGRLDDLRTAAGILKGRNLAPGVRMIVTPASREIWQMALRDGTIEILAAAGCTMTTPGCGPCAGLHLGVLGDGESCISSSSRNFLGRMGNRNATVYLGSPATVAASALTGWITDPRDIS